MTLKTRQSILDISPYKGGLSKTGKAVEVLKLSSNETPLGPSPKAIAAFKESASTLYRYPEGSSALLREAIGEVYNLNPEQIICGAGSDELISFLCTAYTEPGDEVLYTEHGFLMYKIYAMAVGAKPVSVPEKNLRTDVDAILKAVTGRTRIVFVANPNNPTGSYISRDEMIRLRKGLPENVLLVIDGAYAEYVAEKDYTKGEDLVDMGNNTVMTRTFSKIYGLASLRIGWAYCPLEVIDILNRVRGPFNVSTPAMNAAVAAVKDKEFTEKARILNANQLKFMTEQLTAIGLNPAPSVGNFIMAKFPNGEKNAANAFEYLMENGIIVRPVANYGLEEYLRITIGLEKDNKRVIDTLKKFMNS